MNASVGMMLSDQLGPSDHALNDSYREHFPEATREDLLADVRSGTPLKYELVRALTYRPAVNPDHYKLAREGKSPRVRRGVSGIRRLKPEWIRNIFLDEEDPFDPEAIYILSVHRRGIFVIDSETKRTVITYLRLTAEAQRLVADV